MELKLQTTGESLQLLSPGVGWFTLSRSPGEVLSTGETAGVLITLGCSTPLIVPAGVTGRIVSEQPELVRSPVDFSSVLYELEPVTGESSGSESQAPQAAGELTGLILTVPQSGRLYRARAPGEPPLIAVGDEVADGTAVCLIEIMKTFSHVHYRAKSPLPERAKIVEFLAEDGADVRRGDPLLRVEAT